MTLQVQESLDKVEGWGHVCRLHSVSRELCISTNMPRGVETIRINLQFTLISSSNINLTAVSSLSLGFLTWLFVWLKLSQEPSLVSYRHFITVGLYPAGMCDPYAYLSLCMESEGQTWMQSSPRPFSVEKTETEGWANVSYHATIIELSVVIGSLC